MSKTVAPWLCWYRHAWQGATRRASDPDPASRKLVLERTLPAPPPQHSPMFGLHYLSNDQQHAWRRHDGSRR